MRLQAAFKGTECVRPSWAAGGGPSAFSGGIGSIRSGVLARDEDDNCYCRVRLIWTHWGETSEQETKDLLRRDAGIAEPAVLRLITVSLTDGQFDALVPFEFNLGAGALQRSTLHRKVNREEHAMVPAEFMKWIWPADGSSRGW